jgi:hypothetical protein
MQLLPGIKYYYAHGKSSKILKDIPNLESVQVIGIMHPMAKLTFAEGTIFVNTWIGRDGRYVLPGIGCTVEKLYEMHNEILKDLGGFQLTRDDVYSYIPKIDFSYYDLAGINKFLIENKDRRKILISNGNVQSNQAFNFDFNPVIDLLCKNYPDIIFIVTSPTNLVHENLINSGEVVNIDQFDLNEIAYLSIFTDTIIGRSSGPHTFSQHMDNWLDPNKVNLAFTYENTGSHFVLSNHLPMKKDWSSATDTNTIYQKICGVIER